jgi:hypothetical protein
VTVATRVDAHALEQSDEDLEVALAELEAEEVDLAKSATTASP